MAPHASSAPSKKAPSKAATPAAQPKKRATDALERRLKEAIARAVPLIRKGNFPITAAVATHTPSRTWLEWETRARTGEEPYATCFLPVEQARAEAETGHVAAIVEPKKDVYGRADATRIHARQFMLERAHRSKWGARVELRMKLEDEFKDLLTVRLRAKLSAPAYAELVRVLAEMEIEDQEPGHDDGE